MEEFLTEADPRFKPPSQWKKGLALRDLSTLKPPKPLDGLEKILRPYQAVGIGCCICSTMD